MIVLIQPNGDCYAQKVSINLRQAPLEKIFQLIEQQTNYRFVYNTSSLINLKKIDVDVEEASVIEVLNSCLKNQPLTYTIVKNNIIIRESETQQYTSRKLTISGNVRDDDGNGLFGVRVGLKPGNSYVYTNSSGDFKITLNTAGTTKLLFEASGFLSQEIAVSDKARIDIKLLPESKQLDEMIIVGYGEVNRRDVTGSVGVLKKNNISKSLSRTFADAMAGRIAGVLVTSPDGQPGAVPSIIVRGGNSVTQYNSPLYVIDGLPIEDYNINLVHPEDIESIEVLKDASSTAIYGARGANGVVILTTKKGQNAPSVLSINSYYAIQNNTSEIALMKPYEFVRYQLELDSSAATQQYLTNGKSLQSYAGQQGINWQEELFRNAPIYNFYGSLRGGNKTTSYALSGSVLDQKGTVISSGFKRYQARLVFDQLVSKKLTVGVNGNVSSLISYGTVFTGNRNTYLNILINAWQYRPIAGDLTINELLNNPQDPSLISSTNYQWNPIVTAQNELRDRYNTTITSNLYGSYELSKNLKFKSVVGLNSSMQRNEEFNNSKTRLGSLSSALGQRGVNGSITYTENQSLINENTIVYQKTIEDRHFFNALSGFTIQQNSLNYYGSGAIRIPNEELGIGGLSQGTPIAIQNQNSANRLLSFLGRMNYNYLSKYLLTATLRADGSSKFSPGNKWGYFPSGSIAWNLAEEKFFKEMKFLSESKIRLSYGLTGNNRVSDYAYFGTVSQGGNSSYNPGGVYIDGAYVSNLGNPDLKWETTSGFDIGLDLGFLNQRYTITLDLYKKNTRDLLLNASLPTSSGFSNVFQNIGSVQNKGLELQLQTFNVQQGKFKWNTSFNISFNRNKLIGLAQNQQELLSTVRWNSGNDYAQNPAYIAKIGQPVAMFFGYRWNGNYQFTDFDRTPTGVYTLKTGIPNNGDPRQSIQPGDIKYEDINGDNQIDISDRTIIGNPNPKFYGGISNDFVLKNFDFHVFFQFVYGNDIMNVNRYLMEGGTTTSGANQFASYENRWTPENPSNQHFRVRGWGPSVYSSRVIEDGSFLRLKTINIGYKMQNGLCKKLALSSFRIFLAAQNLITFTKYSGNDPEVSVFDSALTPGLDYSAYPRAKMISVGLDISF